MQVSGLASGLDVKSMVTQLMSLERRAGASLTSNKTASESLVKTLQRLNTLVKDMSTAAKALVPDTIFNTSAWASATATTSNAAVASVTTANGATAGSYAFTVTQVASAGSAIAATGFDSKDAVVNANAFSLGVVKGGVETKVDIAAGATLDQVASTINGKNLGVTASVVTKADGQAYLQLASTTTGAASNLSLTNGNGGTSTEFGASSVVSSGKDTLIKVGDGPGAYTVSSSTAKVDGFIPNVTVTALKADPAAPVTVDVKADSAGLADKVKAMVDAANSVMSNIEINSKWNAGTKITAETRSAIPFLGDSTTRELRTTVQNVFVGEAGAMPSTAGIELTRDGSLKFDRDAFIKAYEADPKAVEQNLTKVAEKLDQVGKAATNTTDGSLTVRIQGEQRLAQDYTKQITKFEDRMAMRQATLERQFAALESMLSKLQSQGNWLAGQIKSLPTASSSSD